MTMAGPKAEGQPDQGVGMASSPVSPVFLSYHFLPLPAA